MISDFSYNFSLEIFLGKSFRLIVFSSVNLSNFGEKVHYIFYATKLGKSPVHDVCAKSFVMASQKGHSEPATTSAASAGCPLLLSSG
jgi:hypothetical protein